jgi:hypothetical protein
MVAVLEKLRSKMEADQQSAATEWETLVGKVCDDDASETEISKVLKRTGRSVDELQAAVERTQTIRQLRAEVEKFAERSVIANEAHKKLMGLRPKRLAAIRELDLEERRFRSACWTANQAVERSRNAAIKLEKLTGEPVELALPREAEVAESVSEPQPETEAVTIPAEAEVSNESFPVVGLPSDCPPLI